MTASSDLKISANRLRNKIESLARIGATEYGGVSRLVFTPEDMKARDLVTQWMRDAGLKIQIDNVGNIFGRKQGSLP